MKDVSPETVRAAKLAGRAFEGMMHCLRNEDNPMNIVPRMPVIRDAINLLWDMVGNKFVAVGSSNGFKTISFFSVKAKDQQTRAFIILPEKYPVMATHDTPMQMGAMVAIASQVKDYWNNRLDDKTERRTFSMEAHFIKTLLEEFPHIQEEGYPNRYQQKLLEKYPDGIESALDVHYKSRPFDISAGPPWPMPVEKLMQEFKEADSIEELMKICGE